MRIRFHVAVACGLMLAAHAMARGAAADAAPADRRVMANDAIARGDPDRPAAGGKARARAAAEKRICRTETVTGSLVQKRRVCATAAERDAAARSAQGTLRGMTGGGCMPGGEGC